MTAEEIRATKNESDDGTWETARWLQEIAAQLAEANARGAKKGDALDSTLAELMPLLSKVKEVFGATFDPPAFGVPAMASGTYLSNAPMAMVPSAPLAVDADAPLLDYLKSRGHDEDRAKQILANHRAAIEAEMKGVSGEVPNEQKDEQEKEEEKAIDPEAWQPDKE